MTDQIEINRQALMRILAMLVSMAGEGGTVTRLLRNAVLRLLRPAESAARRLVVALARTLTVTLPKARSGRGQKLRGKRHFEPMMPQAPHSPRGAQNLPLLDRLRRRRGIRTARDMPRIGFFDRRPVALPPPCRPDDPVDAARLRLRLEALGAALDKSARPRAAFRALAGASGGEARKGARRPGGLAPGFAPRRAARHATTGRACGGRSSRRLPPAGHPDRHVVILFASMV